MALTYNDIVTNTTISNLATIWVEGNTYRHYQKNVSGFALICYYVLTDGWYTGPLVVSPTMSVASYSSEVGTTKATSSTYITVNGTKWYYTPFEQFLYGNLAPASATAKNLGQFSSHINAVTDLVNTYYNYVSKITSAVSPSSAGSVSLSGTKDIPDYYVKGTSLTATAYPNNTYNFTNWKNGSTTLSTQNSYVFNVSNAMTLTATFTHKYSVDLTYDSQLGSASVSWNGDVATLTATPVSSSTFNGWYLNGMLISATNPYSYRPTSNQTIEARFVTTYTVFDVSTSVVGNGAIDYHRQGTNLNIVTFTVIPNANHHFVKYVIDGFIDEYFDLVTNNDDFIITYNDDNIEVVQGGVSEDTTTPLVLLIKRDVTVTAYFEEDDKFHITAGTNIPNASVYVSHNDDYAGYQATLWARPFPDYNFIRWEDGNTDNPRTITVTENVTMIAIYHRVTDTNGIYQYRCFIKDQLDMTAPPKAFMIVDTFTVRTDLLTNATSDIVVLDTISNVNEGDVLVLYDPKGQFLYNGVINAIEDKTIQCSQMQSFYKGTWIYSTSSQDFLEHELAVLLQDYANGRLRGSSYVDNQVKARLSGITIDYIGTTTANLPTTYQQEEGEDTNFETIDMEEFIYEMYRRYGIVFDFEINLSGTNYVHIKVPSYAKISVGNNMFAIQDMSPITEIEETNKLVVYASDNTYRTTYIATKNGIVEAPTSTANRFNITNTVVVFSDDPIADLVASNLPQTMYNHKLTFVLLIKNFIYEFGDFNLGGELDVYYGDDYYNSVLTGYEISKSSNQNITEALFTCGMVRKALTKLLTLGKV